LLLSRIRWRIGRVAGPVLAALAFLTVLAAPTTWAVVSVQAGNGGAWLPGAGPSNALRGGRTGTFTPGAQGLPTGGQAGGRGTAQQGRMTQPPIGQQGAAGGFAGGQAGNRAGVAGGQAMTFAGASWNNLDTRLVQYLVANQGSAAFLVATPTSSYASVFMLATDQPALALGGYQGWDQILTVEQLAALVQQGSVRFFYLSGGASGATRTGVTAPGVNGGIVQQDAAADLNAWVQGTCAVVPSTTWQGTGATPAESVAVSSGAGQQLYDCAAVGSR
jgi:hypothetical protein